MSPDEWARVPGDLLVQAVEGVLRPMFVLDERWHYRYVNPAGAQVLERTVAELVGRDIWTELPEAVGGRSSGSTARCAGPAGVAPPRPRSARCGSGSAPMLLDEGRDLLRDLVGRSVGLPLDVLCNRLLTGMLASDVEDDAVLAVRVHPLGVGRPAVAGAEAVPAALPTV